MKNKIYLEKRLKVLTPPKGKSDNKRAVVTIMRNLESLGYIFSRKLATRLSSLSGETLNSFYLEIVPVLKQMRGAHKRYNPMYPNFPIQVIEASDYELYTNAIIHYWSFVLKDAGVIDDCWLPSYQKEERPPLLEEAKLDVIDLGSEEGFEMIFHSILRANTSISQSDKDIVKWFVQNYKDDVVRLLPESIPQKEQLSLIAGEMLQHTTKADVLTEVVKTATDVLRIGVAFSGGDVSLAENSKFGKFKRNQRRFFLNLLENCNNIQEDMLRFKNKWIRFGEKLHPGELSNRYPKAFAAFKALRNNEEIETFNGNIEAYLGAGSVANAVDLLKNRPGDFARRLDVIFRKSPRKREEYALEFLKVAEKVSTPVLLQVYNHFKHRGELDFRPVFPKGSLAKIQVLEKEVPKLPEIFCKRFANDVRSILIKKFKGQEKLGKVYLDEKLSDYLVPFSQRSAAKALKTIVRGSKVELDGDYDTIRFFIWWKDGNCRTDIDLAGAILDENFQYTSDISYYNLKDLAGHHSGDITAAPNGACEFIDISLEKVLENGGRYIAMNIYSYTGQPLCELPECFAGWMGREKPNSGEIFEARTVKNKIDLTANTQACVPLLIDALERKVIWMDISLKTRAEWSRSGRNNKNSLQLISKAMAKLKKVDLFDLLSMHVEARGKRVKTPEAADLVFSTDTGTQFDLDNIASKYL